MTRIRNVNFMSSTPEEFSLNSFNHKVSDERRRDPKGHDRISVQYETLSGDVS